MKINGRGESHKTSTSARFASAGRSRLKSYAILQQFPSRAKSEQKLYFVFTWDSNRTNDYITGVLFNQRTFRFAVKERRWCPLSHHPPCMLVRRVNVIQSEIKSNHFRPNLSIEILANYRWLFGDSIAKLGVWRNPDELIHRLIFEKVWPFPY